MGTKGSKLDVGYIVFEREGPIVLIKIKNSGCTYDYLPKLW